jgi:hypothetical protein
MAAGLGFKTFVSGDVLTAGDTNGYLMQGVLVFASAAARDSAITSPQEGQFAYLKDTDATTYYTGSAWTALGGGGSSWSLLNSGGTALSGGTTTVSGISGKDKIMVLVEGASTGSSGSAIRFQVNTLATAIYTTDAAQFTATSTYAASNLTGSDERGTTSIVLASMAANAASDVDAAITLTGCNSTGLKQFSFNAAGSEGGSSNNTMRVAQGFIDTSATISSISILVTSGSFDAGTVYVYASA